MKPESNSKNANNILVVQMKAAAKLTLRFEVVRLMDTLSARSLSFLG